MNISAKIRPMAVIAGIADGLGTSLANALAAAGYDVTGLARSRRVEARISQALAAREAVYDHVVCDLTQPGAVEAVLQGLAPPVDVLIYNAHELLIDPFMATVPAAFERLWKVNCFGAMLAVKALLPQMLDRGSGTVIFTGATAGLRGGARFSAFSSAKFALRGLAQSLAREYGPRGIHIVHVVLDGLIDGPQTERRFGKGEGLRMVPGAIATCYIDLIQQHSSAWTQELDLRPSSEPF